MAVWAVIVAGCAPVREVPAEAGRVAPPGAAAAAAPAPPDPGTRGVPADLAADPGEGRIVAIGDLHGDLDNAIASLALLGVVDAGGHWTGGKTTLVQTGDTVDRGDDSRGVLAWLRALGPEASAAGGRVVALLGNHEVMNLRGDWRYVSAGDLAAYGGEAARKAAYAADGEDGRWLRTLDVAAKVGRTVFVHGGIRPAFATDGVGALSERVRKAIDAPAEDPVLGPDGPLWYRDYVRGPEETACPELGLALDRLDADRMVVGHTTRDDGRIESRCGGALLVIDIGVSDGYGAHLGALTLRGGVDAWAAYPSGPADLPDPQ